jgi:Tfp pilus assembly protein PilV
MKKINESGFSLVEALIAILIMTIAITGIIGVFSYSAGVNSKNRRRTQSAIIAQSQIEAFRFEIFTNTLVSNALQGGSKATVYTVGDDGFNYAVDVTVDDDPFTNGIQTNSATKIKEITVTVTPVGSENSWVTASPALLVTRRSKSN